MSQTPIQPSEDAIREAKKHPNGWVYQIDARSVNNDCIPPEAIVGAWKVDTDGNIIGEFLPNSRYAGRPNPTDRKIGEER